MSAHLTLTLDTAPPASPTLVFEDGARTGEQVVALLLGTTSPDVTEMKVWGAVDPTADSRIQATEDDSDWMLWDPTVVVRLSAAPGPKTLYARLRDDVLNATPAVSNMIVYDTSTPVVRLVSGPDRSRISLVEGYDDASFPWESNQDFIGYEVRVVANPGSTRTSGVRLAGTHGSIHVADSGSFPADTPIVTTVTGADLRTASPGDSTKTVKVFVQNTSGIWSA